ncbi:F0F1 ATP synthase subunit alpha [Pelolinea submarina]|uniref:ATP synthase subunit alpha n=1 Tax=Pelolinea submarina TaxID=913107 RepID=A0A347ZV57_9CHLR|nr:F0F1 ATP synthase subunit alpha [Pelolinea submarina]REG10226.1 ATP synthase F1 subcomplex alpha subunit [Pelolinea submarina]BBB49188.1 F-type H+-transporting ATPase subunit alpha [Pelolinea submarina]
MNINVEPKFTSLESYLNELVDFPAFEKEVKNRLGETDLPRLDEDTSDKLVQQLLSTFQQTCENYTSHVTFEEIGTVQHVGNGVANLSGLSNVGVDELVNFPNGVDGLVLNLESDSIDVILLGEETGIHGGDRVTSRRERIRVPVGPDLLGRVINPLGAPLDDLPEIQPVDMELLEKPAPGIIERSPVNEPLQTGNKMIDALFSVGRGQRELIVGDRQIGKTTLAVDTILNQKNSNVVCIYVSIGQKKSSVLSVINTLKTRGAMEYSVVVIASPDDPPALRYLAPFAGCTMGEYFLQQGRDVLIVYDDLGKHADAYREISLLLRRPPGREAYPGDIFYLHSRLLERACKLSEEQGGGSLTALPIIPLQQSNLAAYIPTNLISICDGQIVLNTEKFNRGLKPAVDIGLSVSRVGSSAQSKAMRSVSEELKLELSQFEEVEQFTRFGTEIDEATLNQIQRGQRLQLILAQPNNKPLTLAEEVIILTAGIHGYLDAVDLSQIGRFEDDLLSWFKRHHSDMMNKINHEKTINDIRDEILNLIHKFTEIWTSGELSDG